MSKRPIHESSNDGPAQKTRKFTMNTRLPAKTLLDMIPAQVALGLYVDLLEIRVPFGDKGCFKSEKHKLTIGHYPRIQIPNAIANAAGFESVPKGQLKVGLHQLAYRAKGLQLPDYEANVDIGHTCGNGKAEIGPDNELIGGYASTWTTSLPKGIKRIWPRKGVSP